MLGSTISVLNLASSGR